MKLSPYWQRHALEQVKWMKAAIEEDRQSGMQHDYCIVSITTAYGSTPATA